MATNLKNMSKPTTVEFIDNLIDANLPISMSGSLMFRDMKAVENASISLTECDTSVEGDRVLLQSDLLQDYETYQYNFVLAEHKDVLYNDFLLAGFPKDCLLPVNDYSFRVIVEKVSPINEVEKLRNDWINQANIAMSSKSYAYECLLFYKLALVRAAVSEDESEDFFLAMSKASYYGQILTRVKTRLMKIKSL